MTDHMGRTLADAIKAAAKLKDELPHIVQVYPSDHDTIIMAAEIERLRGIVAVWLDLAIGPDEMGDYYRQKQVIKASQEALGETK
jgi:hypothetical protein